MSSAPTPSRRSRFAAVTSANEPAPAQPDHLVAARTQLEGHRRPVREPTGRLGELLVERSRAPALGHRHLRLDGLLVRERPTDRAYVAGRCGRVGRNDGSRHRGLPRRRVPSAATSPGCAAPAPGRSCRDRSASAGSPRRSPGSARRAERLLGDLPERVAFDHGVEDRRHPLAPGSPAPRPPWRRPATLPTARITFSSGLARGLAADLPRVPVDRDLQPLGLQPEVLHLLHQRLRRPAPRPPRPRRSRAPCRRSSRSPRVPCVASFASAGRGPGQAAPSVKCSRASRA